MRSCFLIFFTLMILPFGPVISQSFSCSFGTTAACLDYGDKICSSMGKCVSDDAVCFSSFTCGYGGFVCKSSLEDMADDYDEIVSDYNNLRNKCNNIVDDYNNAVSRHSDLVDDYNDLNSNYKSILNRLDSKQDELFEYRNCVESSKTLVEALRC